ncbi:MAG: kelch motif-containing protein [bacterium]|nr:kelch motif-containing protein [bacterium]
MLRSLALPLLAAVSFSSSSIAQEWVEVEARPRFDVAIWPDAWHDGSPLMTRNGEVHDWHGSGWRKIASLPPGFGIIIDATWDPRRAKSVMLLSSSWPYTVATYELDADGWSALGPAPSTIVDDLCYDPTTQLVVGLSSNGTTQTTQDHAWTGSTWLPLTANVRPFHVQGQLITDHARSRIVAFTPGQPGPSNETWEWDGTTWTQLAPATVPPIRETTVLSNDRAGGGVLMFGGVSGGAAIRDTWRWDGTDWTQLPIGSAANASGFTALTFDRVAGAPLLLDRANQSAVDYHLSATGWVAGKATGPTRQTILVANDFSRDTLVMHDGSWTHVWNGNDWTRSLIGGPSRRVSSMAFDWSQSELVVFGGITVPNQPNTPTTPTDTWTFDGAAWQQRAVGQPPTARQSHALVSSFAQNGVLMFGGLYNGSVPLQDTWLWSQGTWTDLTPSLSSAPPAGRATGAVGPPGMTPSVLAGGELWDFNGAWNPVDAQAPTLSAARLGVTPQGNPMVTGIVSSPVTAAFERVNGSWLPRSSHPRWFAHHALYPGRGDLLGFDSGEPWAWSTTPATSARYGAGCGSPEIGLQLGGRATIGKSFELQVDEAQGLVLFVVSLSTARSPLGPSCVRHVGGGLVAGITSANPFGVARLPANLPYDPAFRQLDLFYQAANLQSGGPYFGMRVSAGLRVRIGD